MVAHSSLLLFKLGLSKLSVRSVERFVTSDRKVLFVVEIKQSMFMQLSVEITIPGMLITENLNDTSREFNSAHFTVLEDI